MSRAPGPGRAGGAVGFVAGVAFVCSIVVTGSAVMLAHRREANERFHQQRNVVAVVSSLLGVEPTRTAVDTLFGTVLNPVTVDLETGLAAAPSRDDDPWAVYRDPDRTRPAPPNDAGVGRVPRATVVYTVTTDSREGAIVLPLIGGGLWAEMRGYLALSADLSTVVGIRFFDHEETPGLGGQVADPEWADRWTGRAAFDSDWNPVIRVVRGRAPPQSVAPHSVDGIAGATLTSDAVTRIVHFWLGPAGFGPFLRTYRSERGIR